MAQSKQSDNTTHETIIILALSLIFHFLSWNHIRSIARIIPSWKTVIGLTTQMIQSLNQLAQKLVVNYDLKNMGLLLGNFLVDPIVRSHSNLKNLDKLPWGKIRDYYYLQTLLDAVVFAVGIAIPDPVVFDLIGSANSLIKYLLIIPPMYLVAHVTGEILQAMRLVWLQDDINYRYIREIDWYVLPELESLRRSGLSSAEFKNDERVQRFSQTLTESGYKHLAKAYLELGSQGYTQLIEPHPLLAKLYMVERLADSLKKREQKPSQTSRIRSRLMPA